MMRAPNMLYFLRRSAYQNCAAHLLASLVLVGNAQLSHAVEPAAAGTEHVIAHVVAPGESFQSIAQQLLQNPADLPILLQTNGLTRPHKLEPGATIQLPYERLHYEARNARIVGVTGQIQILAAGALRQAHLDSRIIEGDLIETGPSSYLTLELDDGSRVSLPSNTMVEVERLRYVLYSKEPLSRFRILRGRIEAQAQPQKGYHRLEVHTPSAIAGVRGTRFRIAVSNNGSATRSEVLSGAVAVKSSDATTAETLVPAQFGNITDNSLVGAPMPLLSPPELAQPGKEQEDRHMVFSLKPVPGATGYRARLSRDAGFTQVLMESESPSPSLAFDGFEDDGVYFLCLSAIDDNGLEGLESVITFVRRFNPLETKEVKTSFGAKAREYHFAWFGRPGAQYHFRLARDPKFEQIVTDLPALNATHLSVENLPPGRYFWTVESTTLIEGQIVEKITKPNVFDVFTPINTPG